MTQNNRDTAKNRAGSNIEKDQNESDYKNTETSVDNPGYFDDAYESKAEDEITDDEAKTEKEGRVGKK